MRMTMKGKKRWNSSWRFYHCRNAAIAFLIWQIVNNVALLLWYFWYLKYICSIKKHPRSGFQNFQLVMGGIDHLL